jgi:hypothetical protein
VGPLKIKIPSKNTREKPTNKLIIHLCQVHLQRLEEHFKPLKMDLTEGSETSANIKQTLGKHPKVNTVNKLIIGVFVGFSRMY